MALGQLLNLSKSQWKKNVGWGGGGYNNYCEDNETMHIKHIAQCLVYCIYSSINYYNCYNEFPNWLLLLFLMMSNYLQAYWVNAFHAFLHIRLSWNMGVNLYLRAYYAIHFILYLCNLSLMHSGNRKHDNGRSLKFHVTLL